MVTMKCHELLESFPTMDAIVGVLYTTEAGIKFKFKKLELREPQRYSSQVHTQ